MFVRLIYKLLMIVLIALGINFKSEVFIDNPFLIERKININLDSNNNESIISIRLIERLDIYLFRL